MAGGKISQKMGKQVEKCGASRIVNRQGDENRRSRIILARAALPTCRFYRCRVGNETSLTPPLSVPFFSFFPFSFSLSLHFATNAVGAVSKVPIRKMEPSSVPGRRRFDDIVGQESGYLHGETRPCRISHATTSRVCSCSVILLSPMWTCSTDWV